MAAIITENFRIQSAIAFLDSVVNSTVLYYLGISKHTPWDANDGIGADENNPPFPTSNDQARANLWRQMLAAKKLDPNRITLSVPRYDWTSGNVYVKYDTRDDSLFRKPFYVVTGNFDVYKCLDNNNGGTSTIEPTHITAPYTRTLADGYVWHYMYSLTANQANNYVTPQFIPIPSIYTHPGPNGLITTITVDDGGSGYTSPTVTIIGNGATAPTAVATLSGDVIQSISVSGGSADFNWADVVITDTTGTDAVAHANVAPKGGHGNNILAELGAFYVTMNVRLEYDESGEVTINNEYRKMCLVRDPWVYGTNPLSPVIFSGTVADQRTKLELSGITGTFDFDEVITGTTPNDTARVVEYDTDSVPPTLYVTDVVGTILATNTITGASGSATVDVVIAPELEPYSGTIDYIEHRKQIVRASDQVEEIRVTFEW